MDSPMEDHEARLRRAHIAEILATEDWGKFGSGDRPESIPDRHFAERKARYTRDGGRSAPWSTGEAAAIASRNRAPESIAHRTYYEQLAPTGADPLTEEERAAIREKVKRRRQERRRNG